MSKSGMSSPDYMDADELAADLNGDGEINVIDIMLLIEIIQGDDW